MKEDAAVHAPRGAPEIESMEKLGIIDELR
jgi:hypothetical protein